MTAHDAAPGPEQPSTTPEQSPDGAAHAGGGPEQPSSGPAQPSSGPRDEPQAPHNPFAPPSSYRTSGGAPLSSTTSAESGPPVPAGGTAPASGPQDTRPYGPPLGALPVARPGLPGHVAPQGAPVPPPPSYPVRQPESYPPVQAGAHQSAQPGAQPSGQSGSAGQAQYGAPAPAGHAGPQAHAEPWGDRPGPPGRRARRRLGVGAVAGIAALALVAGAVGGVAADRIVDGADRRPVDVSLPVAGTPPEQERPDGSVAAVAASVLPSVVSLQVEGADGISTGSGFVIREDGYVLTNNHVVAGGADGGRVTVLFADGRERPAEIVGRTPDYDLAVVKVDESGLTPLVLGDSDAVVVGDPVVAIGAPLGLNGTVTTGIVSALHRPVAAGDSAETAFIDAIQTDAAINPGNSGGPLVNGAGEVVGVNSAIAQPPGTGAATGSIGLGFAIPSNQARRTAQELMESGTATYPVIGVLLDSRYQGEGVQVTTEPQGGQAPVSKDGPAAAAGIQAGDVILSIDGRPVSLSDELIVAIRAKAPGDTVTLRVRTGDQERDVRVVLDEAPSE
ncbi:S1C family serine protease [Oerskovia turbata]